MPSKSTCILMEGKGMELFLRGAWHFPELIIPCSLQIPHFLPTCTEGMAPRVLRCHLWGHLCGRLGHNNNLGKIISYPTTDVCAQLWFLIHQVWITENPGACCNIINVIGNLVLEHSQDSHHTQASLTNHWTFHSSLSHPPYLSLLPNSCEAPFKPYWHDCEL